MESDSSLENSKPQGVSARSAPGLVPYTTSPTQQTTVEKLRGSLVVDPFLSRLARMKHHVRTACRLITETQSRAGHATRALFVTLTYRPGVDWKPKHMSKFIDAAQKWAKRRGAKLRYVWVAEMQQRGAVHYHIVLHLPRRLRLPRPDGKNGWWAHGSSNVQPVRKHAVGYLMKYVSKGTDKPLPAGCRVCGSGGLDVPARAEFHFWRLPRYVRDGMQIGERARRAKGGGWLVPSGEILRSEWGLLGFGNLQVNGRTEGRTVLSTHVRRETDSRGPEYWSILWDCIKEAVDDAMVASWDRSQDVDYWAFYDADCAERSRPERSMV